MGDKKPVKLPGDSPDAFATVIDRRFSSFAANFFSKVFLGIWIVRKNSQQQQQRLDAVEENRRLI